MHEGVSKLCDVSVGTYTRAAFGSIVMSEGRASNPIVISGGMGYPQIFGIQTNFETVRIAQPICQPISSAMTSARPCLYFSSPDLRGGHCFILRRSASTSGIDEARLLEQDVSEMG